MLRFNWIYVQFQNLENEFFFIPFNLSAFVKFFGKGLWKKKKKKRRSRLIWFTHYVLLEENRSPHSSLSRQKQGIRRAPQPNTNCNREARVLSRTLQFNPSRSSSRTRCETRCESILYISSQSLIWKILNLSRFLFFLTRISFIDFTRDK